VTIDDHRHAPHSSPGPQTTPAFHTLFRPNAPDTLPVTAAVVITRGPHTGSRFPLNQPTTSVGRHPRSDVFLDDNTVSRRHAELRAHHTGVQIVDLDSLRGTYLNGAPIDAATELTDGDEIQIGKFHLTFSATKPRQGMAHFLNETG
jgi:pSer/pThr/pTyr-binding forkhead associated (FHA) protein